MTRVCWLLQRVSDVPGGDDWLSPSEREALSRFWVDKRRRDWRLGRWTAKRALARAGVRGIAEDNLSSWTALSVRAAHSGVPRAFLDRGCPATDVAAATPGGEARPGQASAADEPIDWCVSLSHSGEYGLCAVAARPAIVGCDIETIGRRGEEFVIDWFTTAERDLVRRAPEGAERSRMVTLVWSAKESAVKAIGVGLRIDTREVRVALHEAGEDGAAGPAASAIDPWRPLRVHVQDSVLQGWWHATAQYVVTLVAAPDPDVPVRA